MKKAVIHIAKPYDDSMKLSIQNNFISRAGSNMEFEFIDDPSLIGGFVAFVDGRVYDCSLKTRLGNVEKTLKN